MILQITAQTNDQECGVCAITSLHNFYYSQKIAKEQVLDKSHISINGMTIFDFENSAKIAGLECESYEVDWNEFINLNIKNYFVALVATRDGQSNHYVILQKNKKSIKVFDSCSIEPKNLSFNEFKNIFLNVIILVNKKPNKLFTKVFSSAKTIVMFDLKFVLINILLSLLILSTSILAASFLNWIIDSSIAKSSINNLITISFIFIFVYFSNDILTYISNLYISRHIKTYYMLFTNKILDGIEYKQKDFLNKVDKNWIYKVDECVYSISNFCVLEINKLITNIIFAFICICIVGSIDLYMLIFVLVFVVIEFIPFLFSYRKKKELFVKIVRTENKNTQYYKMLIQNLSFESWQTKRKNIIFKIKNNYSNIYKNFDDVTIFKANNELAKSLFKSFAEILLIAVSSYLIIKSNRLTIGKLTFIIAAFSLFKNSCNDILNYFLIKIEFDVYWQVYKDLTDVGKLNNNTINFEDIKSISFYLQNEIYKIESSKKVNVLNHSIHSLLSKSQNIKFNNNIIDKEAKAVYDNVVIIDQYSVVNIDILMNLLNLNPSLYSSYIRHFNLDVGKEPISFYDSIIINLLCATSEKGKIIIIDGLLNYIKPIDKFVVKDIINKIRKDNFVFIVGKEKND